MPSIARILTSSESYNPRDFFSDVLFTQMPFYGAWQEQAGRRVERVIVEKDGKPVLFAQIIIYSLGYKMTYGYIPYGPVGDTPDAETLTAFRDKLKEVADTHNSIFIRIDPEYAQDVDTAFSKLFRYSPKIAYRANYFQPRSEWYVSVEGTEEEILAAMHQKARYCIRNAERKGIVTQCVETGDFSKHFEEFYEILEETATRDHFATHGRKYYEGVFSICIKEKNAVLIRAFYNDVCIVSNLVVFDGDVATFVFGGSRDQYRELNPSYAAQWRGIIETKRRGLKKYNFGGISSDDGIHSAWDGFTNFKKRFGGYVVEHGKFFDAVFKPLWYVVYTIRKVLAGK